MTEFGGWVLTLSCPNCGYGIYETEDLEEGSTVDCDGCYESFRVPKLPKEASELLV